jgi:hypothetical protein
MFGCGEKNPPREESHSGDRMLAAEANDEILNSKF